MVDKDAVIGYDFFKSFTVLLNLREMRLTFKPEMAEVLKKFQLRHYGNILD